MCENCFLTFCTYRPSHKKEQDSEKFCEFCEGHPKNALLYERFSCDGQSIIFEPIKNIKYCPICGKELKEIKYE